LGDGDVYLGCFHRYQVVCDGSVWICVAVRQCTGPTANSRPTTANNRLFTRHSPAPIANNVTAATTWQWGCSANHPARTPITAISLGIHKLQDEL
jgi:hypothetical protein